MEYDKSLEYLYSRGLFAVKLGLKNISSLLKRLNNPQECYKSIHVAGTNGKGSVCVFLSNALASKGYKVGLYTSPHLVDFRERIQINGKYISKQDISRLVSEIKPFVNKHTFFEIVTAIAFKYFQEQKVDYAIIEVGLGGRLDATNVIRPIASVITNISLEHTDYLGETISMIATEKAGIIKPSVPVITGTNGIALKTIKKTAEKMNSSVFLPEESPEISMTAAFQKKNAAIALKTLRILGLDTNIKESFIHTKWPGRFEFINDTLLFDCAHNPHGTKTLAKELGKQKIVLVIGIMKDKNIKNMLSPLKKLVAKVIITRPKFKRAAKPGDIAKYFDDSIIINDVSQAVRYAIEISNNRLVVVTGSIFTVGEAYSALKLFSEPLNTKIHKRSISKCKYNLKQPVRNY